MAYDTLRKKKEGESLAGDGNPYEQTISDFGATSPMPQGYGSIGAQSGATIQRAPQGGGAPGASPFGADTGPTATGFVNFDRLYNANADVAQRESGKKADAAEKAGQSAVAGRTGAQEAFSGAARTGTTKGPNADDYAYATGQRSFYAPPTQNMAQASGKALAAGGSRQQGQQIMPDMSREQFEGRLKSQAASGYGGPDALSKMPGYEDLLKETVAAQDLANNPTTGLGQTDRDLLNAAGRPRFSELEQKYGSLNKDLSEANKASIGLADAARGDSAGAQGEYERLLQDYLDKQEREKPPPAPGETPAAVTANPFGYKSFDEMMADGGLGTDVRDGIHGASQVLDPVSGFMSEVSDGRTISEMFREGAGFGDDLDMQNTRGGFQQIEREFGGEAARWLFDNMSAEDWEAIQGMNAKAVYRFMSDKLKSGEWYQKHIRDNIEATGKNREGAEVGQTGGGGEASQGTTAEEEAARTQAYRDGWGTSYDEQFRSGNRKPVKP